MTTAPAIVFNRNRQTLNVQNPESLGCKNYEPELHDRYAWVNILTRWFVYIFVAIGIVYPIFVYLGDRKVEPDLNSGEERKRANDKLVVADTKPKILKKFSEKEKCSKLKQELRTKYQLAEKKKNISEVEDSKLVLKNLENLLDKQKAFDSSFSESAQSSMNRRMIVANLEYEIDHLEDFIPDIKVKKENAYQEELAKGEKESSGKIYHGDLFKYHIW